MIVNDQFFLKKKQTMITWGKQPLELCNRIKNRERNQDRVNPNQYDRYVSQIKRGELTRINLQNLWLKL